jgi:4-alpha-glucanotransferase
LVIAAPERSHPLRDPEGARRWGVFLPLYALHSGGSWGAGDFADLTNLYGWAREQGASMVGTLPLLAAYLDEPCDPSPYTPVSRQFWNEFYLHLPSIPELERSPKAKLLLDSSEYREAIESLRRSDLADYKRQMALKRRVLGALAETLLADSSGRQSKFWRYVNEHPSLDAYARFRAVQERSRQAWTAWPQNLREGRIGPGDFDEQARVYHLYVQWLADQQLQTLAGKTDGRGLYLDLPLGVHPGGFDVWQEPEAFAQDVAGGAPPDRFFTKGQDWGFAPLHPEAIRRRGYASFIASVRHHLGHAGVLRIDHVMGLHRLYWIPKGFAASQGAYVAYHAEEFYAILNIESRRHCAAIVGEDLGTVPERVRASMKRHGYAGMYVAQFELDPDPERAIHPTPSTSLASLNTHDMRPFAGIWEGLDIADQIELGLLDEQQAARDLRWKESCKWALIEFLRGRGWLDSEDPDLDSILRGCLYEIASRDTGVILVNLEDLWLETRSQNTPGTVHERPNWRRKARYSFEAFRAMPEVVETLRRVNELRTHGR